MKRTKLFFWVSATIVALAFEGCSASPHPFPKAYTQHLIDVPFTKPRSELCASTSLQSVVSYWQQTQNFSPRFTTDEIDKRTLIPQKKGTLQTELVATARADGLLVYKIEPSLNTLIKELNDNHPVIVLVNRGFSWYPLWHYAVVTGYDSSKQQIMTHFYNSPNESLSVETFMNIWQRSDNWAIVPVPPRIVPSTANATDYFEAAYDLERVSQPAFALQAYTAGLKRWSDNVDLLFAAANLNYSLGKRAEAKREYQNILDKDPSHPLALNNLASMLCEEGNTGEALGLIRKAHSKDKAINDILNATYKEITTGCPIQNIQK